MRSAVTRIAVGLLLALTACAAGDPPLAPLVCHAGSYYDGKICRTPIVDGIVVDGDASEWDGRAEVLQACDGDADCAPGAIRTWQVVLEPDGSIALHAVTNGPPVTDGSRLYGLRLIESHYSSFMPVFDDRELWIVFGLGAIYGPTPAMAVDGATEFALTSDGFEARLPAGALPYEVEVSIHPLLIEPDVPGAPQSLNIVADGWPQGVCWGSGPAGENACGDRNDT